MATLGQVIVSCWQYQDKIFIGKILITMCILKFYTNT